MANCKGRNMGFEGGIVEACFKRKYRWLFLIDDVSQDTLNALPPTKAARPSLSFKTMEAQHLNETVYFPAKPEWKPITLSLYDIKKPGAKVHPVFEWVKKIYNPEKNSAWYNSCDGFKKKKAELNLYDGCGVRLEQWVFEWVWPESVEFGDLDMSSSEVVTAELTLRYDRAYVIID